MSDLIHPRVVCARCFALGREVGDGLCRRCAGRGHLPRFVLRAKLLMRADIFPGTETHDFVRLAVHFCEETSVGVVVSGLNENGSAVTALARPDILADLGFTELVERGTWG